MNFSPKTHDLCQCARGLNIQFVNPTNHHHVYDHVKQCKKAIATYTCNIYIAEILIVKQIKAINSIPNINLMNQITIFKILKSWNIGLVAQVAL